MAKDTLYQIIKWGPDGGDLSGVILAEGHELLTMFREKLKKSKGDRTKSSIKDIREYDGAGDTRYVKVGSEVIDMGMIPRQLEEERRKREALEIELETAREKLDGLAAASSDAKASMSELDKLKKVADENQELKTEIAKIKAELEEAKKKK